MADHQDAVPQQQQQEYPAIFISNLQWWTSDVDIETACSKYGKVLNIRFIEDKSCGKSRGMAIVDMDTQDAVQGCIDEMNGSDFHGRPCRVSRQYAKYQGQQQSQQQGQHAAAAAAAAMMMRGGAGGMMYGHAPPQGMRPPPGPPPPSSLS